MMNKKFYQLKHREVGVYLTKEEDRLGWSFKEEEGTIFETYPKAGFVSVKGVDILMSSFEVITYKLVQE